MNDDFINHVTLNCLISKQQLLKLNKKMKQKEEDIMKTDKEIYKERIMDLFVSLLNDETPENILTDVTNSFDYFLQKTIYYLKLVDENGLFQETNNEDPDIEDEAQEEPEDIEDQDEDIEDQDEDIETQDEDEDIEDQDQDQDEDQEPEIIKPIKVKQKYKTKHPSDGVDDIQKLPLNWFNNIRQNYKQHQIIPRKKEIVLDANYKKK